MLIFIPTRYRVISELQTRGTKGYISIDFYKHYENMPILKILPPKNENFQIKISDIFHISAQNINCGYSLEPLQSMFLDRNKKNNLYPCKPQFYYIKVGFKGG